MERRWLGVVGVVAMVGALVVSTVRAQSVLQPTAVVGVWSVRREVITAQRCSARGTQQGDVLATIWTIDAVAGGRELRVTPLGGSDGFNRYVASVAGTQVQLTARASGSDSATILLGKTDDHAMTGTETVSLGLCTATRSVTAVRIH